MYDFLFLFTLLDLYMKKFENFNIIDHPLIKHKIRLIRDKKTGHQLFRDLVNEVGTLIAFEITRDLKSSIVNIDTPLEKTTGTKVNGENIIIVPILRAGLGMVDGLIKLIPNARIGYVGMERNEKTHQPSHYYFKIPKKNIEKRSFIIIDPMLATGGTAIETIKYLKKLGAKDIKFMCLIAAPEGTKALCESHPDIKVFAATLDKKLNKNKYIIPGLGDAGDRLFGSD